MTVDVVKAPISITENAIKQLKRDFDEQELTEEHGLRIGVKGGWMFRFQLCHGF